MSVTKIGGYRLGKTLGLGAFSKVKLGIHELTGEKVAIKILNRKKLKQMDMGAKVRREIDILKMFSHPHIIRLYEVIDTPSTIYCVMEYIEGGEMFDYIVARGRLSEDEARSFFQQIVSGVEYCHFHMVVHRDLKPENLLLDNETSVKIADFGLSNLMKDGQFLKTSCGSPNYAAPEVISGSLYAGPEVDVWSCGVILYAILCGSLPFDDENIRNLFKKIKEGHLNIPAFLSDGARSLIKQMLVVDPMKRIRISDIRNHPWFLKNLPPYLSISAEQRIERAHVIDPEVIDMVVRLGFAPEQVYEAVKMGPDLSTNKKYSHMLEMRQMDVAYNLYLDRKRKHEQKATRNILAGLPGAAQGEAKLVSDQYLTATAVNQLPPAVTQPLGPTQNLTAVPNDQPQSEKPSKKQVARKWLLGLSSKLDPQIIMKDVARVLQKNGFEWKVLTPYKLKARHIFMPSIPSSALSSTPPVSLPTHTVKIGLQLYRSKNLFVIDIQKLQGYLFPFMDLCASVVNDLQRSLAPPSGELLSPASRVQFSSSSSSKPSSDSSHADSDTSREYTSHRAPNPYGSGNRMVYPFSSSSHRY